MEIKLVKNTNLLEEPAFQNYYTTTIDDVSVSGSGSYNLEKATEKYNTIVANAGITKMTEIIFSKNLE
jgi:hypothetical protein